METSEDEVSDSASVENNESREASERDWISDEEDETSDEEPVASSSGASFVIPAVVVEGSTTFSDVCCHEERSIFLTTDMNGEVALWNLEVDEIKATKSIHLSPHRPEMPCRSARFLHEENRAVSIGKDKRICFLDLTSGQTVRTIKKAHDASIFCLTPINQNLLATGDDDGTIKMWDLRSFQQIWSVKEQEEYISALTCDAEGRTLLATSGDGTLAAFSVRRGKMEIRSEPFPSELLSLQIIQNGSRVLCSSGDGSLLLFKWGEWGYPLDHNPILPGHSLDSLQSIDSEKFLFTASDGSLRLGRVKPFRLLRHISHQVLPLERMSISLSNDYFACTSHDNMLRLWTLSSCTAGIQSDDEDTDSEDSDSGKPNVGKKRGKHGHSKNAKKPPNAGADFFADI